MTQLHGLVLAAGAGSRYGQPKALVRDTAGVPWLHRAVSMLTTAGCSSVTIVLGARADEAREFVPADALVAVAADWQLGMSASLGAGLAAAASTDADALLLTLVDLPDLPGAVAERLLEEPYDRTSLRQATFGGRPGHPALIGGDHWEPLARGLTGDRGARPYLVAHGATEVECIDLWHGTDVDRPTS